MTDFLSHPRAAATMRLFLLRLTAMLAAFCAATLAHAAPVPVATVVLLLHGTNSDPTTWNDLVQRTYPGGCPILRLGVPVTETSRCYRYQFAERTVDDFLWRSGDGSTFTQLRNEVRAAVRGLTKQVKPTNLILVGHSRGGLAARAYAQDLLGPPTRFRLGLITLASPHQGTPFGRVSVFMRNAGERPTEAVEQLRFVFSPSVAAQATEHDAGGNPIRTPLSENIFALNDRIGNLTANVKSLGFLESTGLHLGEEGYEDFDLFKGIGAAALTFLTPGSFDRLMAFVLQNIVPINERPVLPDTWSCNGFAFTQHPWACDGDGIVPTVSQQLNSVPGFASGIFDPVKVTLQGVPHTRETARVTEIQQLIVKVRRRLNR